MDNYRQSNIKIWFEKQKANFWWLSVSLFLLFLFLSDRLCFYLLVLYFRHDMLSPFWSKMMIVEACWNATSAFKYLHILNLLMFRFVFEDQIEFIKESVMDGDEVYLLTSLIIVWHILLYCGVYGDLFSGITVNVSSFSEFKKMQFDDEQAMESLEKSKAKSAFEKLQVGLLFYFAYCLLFSDKIIVSSVHIFSTWSELILRALACGMLGIENNYGNM